MRRSTPPARLAIAALLLCGPVARAATRSFPGAAPCNGTLQGCIGSAAAGDRIELIAPGPFDESLPIARPLPLVAAAGIAPVIGGGATARTVTVSDENAATGGTIALQGLTLQHARIAATLGFVDDTTLDVSDCTGRARRRAAECDRPELTLRKESRCPASSVSSSSPCSSRPRHPPPAPQTSSTASATASSTTTA